jgi:hypothetical protein
MTDLEKARYSLDILIDNLKEGSTQPIDAITVNRAQGLLEAVKIIVSNQRRIIAEDAHKMVGHATYTGNGDAVGPIADLVKGPPITATEIKERTEALLADKKAPLSDLIEDLADTALGKVRDFSNAEDRAASWKKMKLYFDRGAWCYTFVEDSTKGLKLDIPTRLRVDGLTPTGRNSGNSTSNPNKEKTNEQR